MGDVTELPTDAKAVEACLDGAKQEAESANAGWAIVILPLGDSVMCLTSHMFSHPRFAGYMEEAKAVSLIAEIETQLSPDAS